MGHDVCGFKNKDGSDEIAYLRRGAFNEQARDIYIALDAQQYDAGCSGDGSLVPFDKSKIREALEKISKEESHEGERDFLNDLLTKGDDSGVYIGFY
jgi:hypothetical protein